MTFPAPGAVEVSSFAADRFDRFASADLALTVSPTCRQTRALVATRQQLLSDDGDGLRSRDSEPDRLALDHQHPHADIVGDHDFFTDTSAEDQHDFFPHRRFLGGPYVSRLVTRLFGRLIADMLRRTGADRRIRFAPRAA